MRDNLQQALVWFGMNYNGARGKLGYCNLLTRLERPQSASGGEAAQRGPDSLSRKKAAPRGAATGIVNGIQKLLDAARLCRVSSLK